VRLSIAALVGLAFGLAAGARPTAAAAADPAALVRELAAAMDLATPNERAAAAATLAARADVVLAAWLGAMRAIQSGGTAEPGDREGEFVPRCARRRVATFGGRARGRDRLLHGYGPGASLRGAGCSSSSCSSR
jgi:hypothetical protein